MSTEKRPAWWPTPEQKLHADAGCAHPDQCNVPDPLGHLPLHRTQATWPPESCSTCGGGGCPDCTDPA